MRATGIGSLLGPLVFHAEVGPCGPGPRRCTGARHRLGGLGHGVQRVQRKPTAPDDSSRLVSEVARGAPPVRGEG
jgi:hypothetical protein